MKGPKRMWWLLIFVGVMLTACGSKLPKVAPPLVYPSNDQRPTSEERVLYGYLVTLASGDFEHLQAFASPQAFEQAQRWWQNLSTQERQWFHQNINLLARVGTGWLVYPPDNIGPVLYFNTGPGFNNSNRGSHVSEARIYYPSIDFIGAEYYLLYDEPGIVKEDFKIPFVLFMLRLQQVKVNAQHVEEWRNICWLVHPYPGEFYGGLKDGASSLQCLYP